MFCLFYRIYGHFVFRSPQPPPWGRTTGAVRPKDYPHREGCVRDKWEAQKPTTALASGLNRRILAWSGKRTLCRRSVKKRGRFACKPAKAPVLAMPNNVPAKATCGWFCAAFAIKSKYLLQPGDTQKIPALKTQGFSRRIAKPGAMRPDYRIPYLRRIFRIRGSRSEIMRS